ncbi:MAG: hypothetical protein DSM106950_44950 [Stigonema ocellatum SAG 48.90 = DSM 106950]|nr:hypothetical protein [Stigonema ocellatum SAG 48.90 = DSM 106950]
MPEEEFTLQLHPRTQETVSLEIPKDTLDSLKNIAQNRDMTTVAVLKFYSGQGLRQVGAQLLSYGVLVATAQVLARHIQSEQEISDILPEIRSETSR